MTSIPMIPSGMDHPGRQREVVRARCRIAGRVIVEEHDRRRRRRGRFTKDLARVHDRRVERPNRDDPDPDHAMLRVEHDDAELLDGAGAILRQQIRGNLARRGELGTFRHASDKRASSQLDRGDDPRGASRSDARYEPQIVEAHAREPVQAAGVFDELVRDTERVAAT